MQEMSSARELLASEEGLPSDYYIYLNLRIPV
jgi:hypothetical protein